MGEKTLGAQVLDFKNLNQNKRKDKGEKITTDETGHPSPTVMKVAQKIE
jgi:hypothetical protein